MFKDNSTILKLIAVFFIALITFSVGYLVRDYDIIPITISNNNRGILASDRALYEVMDQLLESHVSQPTREDLILGAVEGMIDSLDDPYTTYFDLEEAEQYRSNFTETYVGIGITVRLEGSAIVIDEVKAGGPADGAGLKVNDVVTHVNLERITALPFYETIGLIQGEEGTEVTVGVYRPGVQGTIHLPMLRETIDNSSIEYTSYLEGTDLIGYIKVNTFGDQTFELFADAVQELEDDDIDSLIIDLRDNGGGHLLTVYYMMNLFLLNDGDPIFQTDYYSNGVHYVKNYVASNEIKKDYNIVTLINENSASASEVFASGMQEHGGYTLVGTKSFGKGTMQTDILISATVGDKLHLTIGKWLTADGNWVHYDGGSDGITPDIVAEQDEIEKAYKIYLLEEDPIVYNTVSDKVANVQVILNMMGYDLRTDGYFDSLTLAAVTDIQDQNSLVENGQLNDETLAVINLALHDYIYDYANDTQLQAAIDYLIANPTPSND